jgi:hypothetical protein
VTDNLSTEVDQAHIEHERAKTAISGFSERASGDPKSWFGIPITEERYRAGLYLLAIDDVLAGAGARPDMHAFVVMEGDQHKRPLPVTTLKAPPDELLRGHLGGRYHVHAETLAHVFDAVLSREDPDDIDDFASNRTSVVDLIEHRPPRAGARDLYFARVN